MNTQELKRRLERGQWVKRNLRMYYELNRLNGHGYASALFKAVYCVLFGRRVYYQPRKWQRFI